MIEFDCCLPFWAIY